MDHVATSPAEDIETLIAAELNAIQDDASFDNDSAGSISNENIVTTNNVSSEAHEYPEIEVLKAYGEGLQSR
ncbi:MAG: hypothetical protein AAFW95_03210, partial [Cyanobacteria bacterium J06638_6]